MRNKGINGNKRFLHKGITEICYEIFGFGIRELRKSMEEISYEISAFGIRELRK